MHTAPPPGRAIATSRPLSMLALVLCAVSTASEYRNRMGASATVSELGAYLAMILLLAEAPSRDVTRDRGLPRDLLVGAALLGWLMLRAFVFRLTRAPDTESAFSHVRDVMVPLALPLLVRARVRLSANERRRVAQALVATGALCGALGVSQFLRGAPYLFDGIDTVRYKTLYAQKYWIAEVLHIKVEHLARGLYYFSIAYACALVVPSVLAFAMAWGSRTFGGRIAWGGAFLVCYAGVYFSFSRSILAVVPFGCFLAVRAMAGRLRPRTVGALVAGYAAVALGGPLLHLTSVSEGDINTLSARVGTLVDLARYVVRDPSVLLIGSTVSGWREWNSLAPHNWVANALLSDGVLGALLRVAAWLSLFVSLWPLRRGQPGQAVRGADAAVGGAWAGSFTLLFIVGETEPLSGIAIYLVVAAGLALASSAADPAAAQAPPSSARRLSARPRRDGAAAPSAAAPR